MNPLALLDLIPRWVMALAIAMLLAVCGLQTVRLAGEQAAHAQAIASFADERTKAAQATQRAEAAARAEEARKTQAVQEIANETRQQLQGVRTAQLDAERAAQRLRNELAAALARTRGAAAQPAAASGSPPADAAADLLERVQRRLDEAADGIAGFADESRIAGQACERAFQALNPP